MTEGSGLRFGHDAGPVDGSYFMPQLMGSGCALFDFNGDGLLDVLLLQNGGPGGAKNRLYQGLPGGRFQDVSAGSGLDFAGHCMGVAVGDVNNDGRPDVLVTELRGVRLFLNRGGGKFTDVTREAGLQNLAWGTSAAFFDYDRDGWLDLVVVHYVDYVPGACDLGKGPDYCPPGRYRGTVSRLFHNCGLRIADCGRTGPRGLSNSRWRGTGFGAVMADFDHDGALDLAFVNGRITRGPMLNPALGEHWGRYADRNQVFVNEGDGHFRDISPQNAAFCGTGNVARGLAWGDVDGDGAVDLLVTTLAGQARLYKNVAPKRGHWLLVRAVGPALRRDALGAEVRVRAGGRPSCASSTRPPATCAAATCGRTSGWGRPNASRPSRSPGRTAPGRSSRAAPPTGRSGWRKARGAA